MSYRNKTIKIVRLRKSLDFKNFSSGGDVSVNFAHAKYKHARNRNPFRESISRVPTLRVDLSFSFSLSLVILK